MGMESQPVIYMTKTDGNKTNVSSIYLWLHGDELDPEHVTKSLNISPKSSWKKGDRHITKTDIEVTRKRGMWSLERQITSGCIEDHLSQFLQDIDIEGNLFQVLPKLETAEISIFSATEVDQDGDARLEISFTDQLLKRIADIGLDLSVSFHTSKD